ncbi:MAG: glycosyltransferase family 2 protein [Xanthobacteraceae bacterium]|nr:MAG: glycosyltransferase family 2 protein [Xanthobacteraceae bacterium]
MAVHLYTLCWNEADMLGFFFRHYDPWVDRYVVYDDGSTDGSLDILRAHPRVELRRFERTVADSFVLSQKNLQNETWKESRGSADWVVITALDELLEVKGAVNADYLAASARGGVTLIPAIGYQMVSEDYPRPHETLSRARTLGAPFALMNKLSIFNPDAVRETGFDEGRHRARPAGDLRYPPRDELMLLHYKYLNFERTLQRQQSQQQGLGTTDVAKGFGSHYHWSTQQLRADWDGFRARAVDVGATGFRPWENFQGPRWWHPEEMPPPAPKRGRGWREKLGLGRRAGK